MDRARFRSQTGFSMVELMVALVLGVILTGGVISVYISTKSSYNVNNGLGQVEQGGRSALDFMQPVMVLGGYTGCSRPSDTMGGSLISTIATTGSHGIANPVTPVYNFTSPVFGYEANNTGIGAAIPSNGGQTVAAGPTPPQNAALWTPSLTWQDTGSVLYNAIKSTVLQYNDVIMVHEATGNPAQLISPYDDYSAATSNLYIAPSTSATAPVKASDFSVGQFAIASSCNNLQAVTFQIAGVNATAGTLSYASGVGSPGNIAPFTSSNWTNQEGNFTAGASYPGVQPVQTYVFYVGQGVDKWPALFEASFSSTGVLQTQELVSGVENMQVLYGVDIDGNHIPDRFETADQVQNADGGSGASGGAWNTPIVTPPVSSNPQYGQVVSIRIALVMQSDDNSIDKAPAAATAIHMLGTSATDSVSLTPPVDRRVRRYFVQTFSLRNVLP